MLLNHLPSRKIIISLLLLTHLPLLAKKQIPDSIQIQSIPINGYTIEMRRVEGGAFVMGATSEQFDVHIQTNKPAHLVFLSPYYVATTEVTNQLWNSVMYDRPSLAPKGYPTHPVTHITWVDCQEFVRRLDSITGLPFRLLTEAEWEYAARGGEKTQTFRFAGGNDPKEIGWTYTTAGQWTHPVGQKKPNELGLYDMTGNVAEWCQDRYAHYQLSTLPNPCGADTGSYRIVRGGSYDDCDANSHLSVRRWEKPETAVGYIGLRVAYTLPNDPILQVKKESHPLTKRIWIKGRRILFQLVPADKPYYISQEISTTMWKRIMGTASPDRDKSIAIGMTNEQRVLFAEQCSRIASQPLFVASTAEQDTAIQRGVIKSPKDYTSVKRKKKEPSIRQIQRKRKISDKLSPFTELFGVRIHKPEDPILKEYNKDYTPYRPLRLCIRL